jgi:hypothetical protein
MLRNDVTKAAELLRKIHMIARNSKSAETSTSVNGLLWDVSSANIHAEILETCRAMVIRLHADELDRTRAELQMLGVVITDDEIAADLAKEQEEWREREKSSAAAKAAEQRAKQEEEAA